VGVSPLFQLVPLSFYNILADLLQFDLFFGLFQPCLWGFSDYFDWLLWVVVMHYCGGLFGVFFFCCCRTDW
jgi:hypothetical protein